ncbi:MAG: Bug family tripartite tricarboxylate transporter substrate binding protein [Burkholderiaceae bacterium]
MNFRRKTLLMIAATLSIGSIASSAAATDAYPDHPVTYIVPFPPGGTTDVLARLITPKLATALGHNASIIIENRGGAAGSVGSAVASRAAPDGYTLLGGTISSHAINVSMYPHIGYDPVKSFEPVALIGTNPTVLLVRAESPYKTLQDVLNAAKSGKALTCASAGSGTSQHMSLELLKLKTGIDVTHVPYKGSGPALTDMLGGQVDLLFETPIAAAPYIKSGKLRALAVSSAKRAPSMPNVPTIAESGVPGYDVVSWQGVFAPAGTPKAIVEELHGDIEKILAQPEMKDRLAQLGMDEQPMTTAQFAKFQQEEVAKWAEVVKKGHIKAN